MLTWDGIVTGGNDAGHSLTCAHVRNARAGLPRAHSVTVIGRRQWSLSDGPYTAQSPVTPLRKAGCHVL